MTLVNTTESVDRSSRSRMRSVSSRLLRRCRRLYVESRWKYLGYDFLELARNTRLLLHRNSRYCQLLRPGDFEAAEQDFLRRFLRSGDIFVDVGANIGLFTLLAGHLVGPSGRVLAFEPCSSTFNRLLRNVRRNGMSHISCYRLALSNTVGVARLSASRSGFDAWNSLAGSLTEGIFDEESVPTTTWDAFAARYPDYSSLEMMKIDVEGWEMCVLEGAQALLRSALAPHLQVEFTPANALAAGHSCEELFERIRDFGYRLYRYVPDDGQLKELDRAPTSVFCNLYASKRADEIVKRIRRPAKRV